MEGMMKAAVFKDIEQIVVEERPIPPCPEGGLLIRVHRCGICGGDVRNYHNGLKGGVKDQIMGHEISGEVVEVSPSLTRFQTGDRVALAPDVSCGACWYCRHGLVNLCTGHRMLGTHFPGGYAQYLALPKEVVERGFIEMIPEGMSYCHAAFAETASAVIACQDRLSVSLGDTVVIIGDGPVGCLHVEVARARGAGGIVMIGMDKLTLAAGFHPDLLLSNRDPEEAVRKVLEFTGGLGADFIICAVPSVKPQSQALLMARKRGTVVIYGGVPAHSEETVLNSNLIHYNELTVTGAFSYPATGLAAALLAIHSGKINAEAYLTACVPLERVVEGMDMVSSGQALKVLIDPWM